MGGRLTPLLTRASQGYEVPIQGREGGAVTIEALP